MVLRLLTPLKMSYEAAKKRAEPYNKIVGELPEMRRDTIAAKGMRRQRFKDWSKCWGKAYECSEGR
jgi:hypothetical protein